MIIRLNIADKNTNTFKINKPTLIGTFRTDVTPVSNDNIKKLYMRYKPNSKRLPIDLERGFEEHLQNKKYRINNKFENLLEWLQSNEHLLYESEVKQVGLVLENLMKDQAVDFVASSGVISTLLKCQYELKNEFTLVAEKHNGIIYLKMKKQFQKNFGDFEMNNYCEEKFRELNTENMSDDDFEESKLNQWVSFNKKNEEQKSKMTEKITFVFRSKIKKHSVIFADEIDCLEELNSIDKNELGIVKFRLARKPFQDYHKGYLSSIRKLRWWSQCVLSDVKRIVVGYWYDNHLVDEVKEYSLIELRSPMVWCPNVCLNNLNQIFSFIKNGFNHLGSSSVAVIHHKDSKELICVHSNLKILPTFYKTSKFDANHNILPSFYKMSLV